MDMKGEHDIPAPRQRVWDALNDPEVLKASIPGCQSLEKTEDGGFDAAVKAKVGPVSATFKGSVALSDIDPPNGYRISGEGKGGAAGFAKGGATVALSDLPDGGTKLAYEVEAQVGGKLAQIGSRLIDSTAKKMANEFFTNFAAQVAGPPAAAAEPPAEAPAPAAEPPAPAAAGPTQAAPEPEPAPIPTPPPTPSPEPAPARADAAAGEADRDAKQAATQAAVDAADQVKSSRAGLRPVAWIAGAVAVVILVLLFA